MKRSILVVLAGLFVVNWANADGHLTSYKIDKTHSSILFKVKHAKVGYVYGWFRNFSGTFLVPSDAKNASSGAVSVEIMAKSIYTNDKKRDKHLASPDFFNAKKHPKVHFKSTKVEQRGDRYTVHGTLTMHGKVKNVRLALNKTGEGKGPYGKHRWGFHGKVKIKRSDFGMSKMIGPIGDEVEIIISGEGIKTGKIPAKKVKKAATPKKPQL